MFIQMIGKVHNFIMKDRGKEYCDLILMPSYTVFVKFLCG